MRVLLAVLMIFVFWDMDLLIEIGYVPTITSGALIRQAEQVSLPPLSGIVWVEDAPSTWEGASETVENISDRPTAEDMADRLGRSTPPPDDGGAATGTTPPPSDDPVTPPPNLPPME